MTKSFIRPENIAITDAVRAHTPLQALLAGRMVYNGIAPAKTPYPYLSLSSMIEREKNFFMIPGAAGSINATIWDYSSDLLRVIAIYEELCEFLHNNRLSLSAGMLIRLKIELIFTGAGDQTDPKIVRGIAKLSMIAISSS